MAAPKGHKKYGGRQKGAKNKLTLLKEERRAIFDAEVSKKWIKTINKLRAEYVADQFMGKAPDIIGFDPAIKEILIKINDILKDDDKS